MTTLPFLKWAGGKRQLLPELRKRLPQKYGTYFEPFLGGGALFFDLRPYRAVLVDANQRLVTTYRAIREYPRGVLSHLRAHARNHGDEAYYYHVRDRFNLHIPLTSAAELAAAFIYLNRTCFNGLWRVNRRGEFNVPRGKYKNPDIVNEDRIMCAHEALAFSRTKIVCADFSAIAPEKGDLVYCDPPYVPASSTAGFTSYTAGGFTEYDQRRLRKAVATWKAAGVHVVVSNADHPIVREIYAGEQIESVDAARAINSKGDKRGNVKEVIIR